MEKKEYKGFFGKFEKFFDWIIDIYIRIEDYHKLAKSHKKYFDLALKSDFEIKNLRRIVERQEENIKKLAIENLGLRDKLTEYRKRVLESPEYIKSEREKRKYKELAEERGKLIEFLKRDKKEIMKFNDSLIRKKAVDPLAMFLEQNVREPYLLLNKEGKILYCTKALMKELGISEDKNIKGKSYLEILKSENIEELKYIKKLLTLEEEKEFDISCEINNKKVNLHVIKKLPIFVPVEFEYRGKERDMNVISCVPLIIEKTRKWSFHIKHSLEKIIEKVEKDNLIAKEIEKEMPKIYAGLIRHGWKSKDILELEKKLGITGAYFYLKNQLNKIEEKERAIKKAKRRKEAKERLKRIKKQQRERRKIERKRDKVISVFRAKHGLRKSELMKCWKESKDFKDFVYKCRSLINNKEQEEEKKKIIGSMIMGVINHKSKSNP